MKIGTIVRSDALHGCPFGSVANTRRNHRDQIESRIDIDNGRLRSQTWLPDEDIETATLDDVLTYFEERERAYEERIKKLREMVGKKVPKYNPDKHLGADIEGFLSDAYRHEDGSITYVFAEKHPDAESPRTYDGNVATLINTNSRTIDVDEDDLGIADARSHFNGGRNEVMLRRWLSIYHPEVIYYADHWSAGDSYGWGYVTRDAWVRAMGEDYDLDGTVTPETAFDAEVKVYGQWANNEIYGSAHVAKRGAEPDFVYGHLGYDDHRDIAAYHSDSPILEVLA